MVANRAATFYIFPRVCYGFCQNLYLMQRSALRIFRQIARITFSFAAYKYVIHISRKRGLPGNGFIKSCHLFLLRSCAVC